jgi:glucosamine-6-phosphate deaminase
MEVVIVADASAAGVVGADVVTALLTRTPDAVLGLATGSSPLPVYGELIRRSGRGEVSFATATAFLLDEYVGLPPSHPASYRRFIDHELARPVGLPPDSVNGPDGCAADIAAECDRYDRAIAEAGGVDVQLLGIGADGHIGFNEPGSSLGSRTRIKTLTEQTRRDNARFFDRLDDVPHHVMTQGVGTILDARHLVLVATGAAKAEPIARAVEGPVTAMVPASSLQLHPHVTVVVDEAAAAALELAGYYREAFGAKPGWQQL